VKRCGFVTPLRDMKLTPRHVEPIASLSENGRQKDLRNGLKRMSTNRKSLLRRASQRLTD
jgi:hypothetical protein